MRQTGEGKRLNQEELVARHAMVSKLWALDRIEDKNLEQFGSRGHEH